MAKRIRIIPWIDRSEFDKQLNEIGKEKHKINVDVNGSGTDDMVQKLNRMNSAGMKSTSIFGKLKNVISNTFSVDRLATTGYIAVLRGINTAADKAKDSIEALNKAETDLMIATDMSRESVRGLMKDYNSYAKELASTTGNISDAANDYLRAGKDLKESQALIKDSIMLSKLGDIESATATEDLLATMNGYEMSIEGVGRALDAMVAIDMKAATSAGDLATGLKYSAASANSAGLSFNKLIAILGTVQDKTMMGAEVVGTFANTMLSRYRDITIGKYLSDDGEDISNYESVLKSCGLELRDSKGEFRAFEDVLEEMAGKWDSLTSVQQNALIKVAAGTRQQNRFIALMEEYSKVLELTEVAATSAGTAVDKFNSSYMTSLEAKENTLQASFESMIYNSDLEEVYGDILDATTALVNFTNQTNALKGVMTGLAVTGLIKGFLTIKTGIHDAYINLNQFQNALNMVKQTNISSADFDRLLLLTNNLSESQMRLILSTDALSISQKEDLLVARGLSREEAKLKLQTYGVTQAQTGLTASTTSAKTAMQGFISVLKANPLFVIATAISAVSMAVSTYKNHLEEVRQATEQSATAYKESSSSIDDYVSRYQDLQKALQDAKGNEESTATVKQQLLDLQNELNDAYGTEYGKLNLVTDAYKDQTEAIKALNKEEANRFLNENRKGISTATRKMEKEREYVLSYGNVSYTKKGKELKNIAEEHGIEIETNSVSNEMTLVLKADAEEAYEIINEFESDLRERAIELGDEHLFDDVLEVSSSALNKAKSVVDKYGEIYHQALMAELVTNDGASEVYESAITAVEEYNQAIAESSDPYNDEKVATAKANLEAVKVQVDSSEDTLGKFSSLFDSVFEQADTKLLDFNEKLKTDTSMQEWAEELKGLSQTELLSMADDGTEDTFDKLVASAEEYGLSVEELIDALIRLGYVQGTIKEDALDDKVATSFTKQLQDVHSLSKGLEELDKIMADVIDGETFDYSSILDPEGDFAKTFGGEEFASEYNALIEAITNSPDDIEKCQDAFNDLATAYVHSNDALSNLSEETRNAAVLDLKQMGVENAEEVVDAYLGLADIKEEIVAQGYDFANITYEESLQLMQLGDVSLKTKEYLFYYQLQKALSNENPLSTVADCEQLLVLAENAGITGGVIDNLNELIKLHSEISLAAQYQDKDTVAVLTARAETLLNSIKEQAAEIKTGYEPVVRFGNGVKSAAAAQDKLKDSTDKATDALEKQKEVLEGQKEEYEALHGAIINYIDGEIDKIDDKIDAINEENEALEKQLDIYDDIISAVTDNIDAEIDAIDEKIEKLQDVNSEEEKALKLEEAKRKLTEAKNRKTVLQYEAGKGFVYHNDENAISEAQSELEALQEEAVIDALEKEKQLLEENKQKWLDIADAREKALKAALARDYFGDDWQTTTLNPSDEMLKNLSDDYIGTQIQIEENDALIEELNKEKEFWENEKELWQDALDEWERIQDEARLKAFFGSDYEYQLLHNSATWRRQFADEYSSVCSEIESLEERIKSASEETASSVASNAEKAGGSLKTVSDGLSEVKTKVEETGNISEYLWSDADETALSSAREQLKLLNELIDSGATELIDARDNLANFVLEYDGLKQSREVSDKLTDSIKTLGSSLSDADSGIGELISGVSDRLANYEQTSSTLAQNAQITAENLGKVNEEINNLQTSEETIESEASQSVSEVETTVTNLVTKLDTLKTALAEIKLSTDEVENVVDEELLDTSEVVEGVHTKVTDIQTAITTLTETITPLQGALESLLETMGKLDEVTLSKIIGQFGGASGSGEGNEGLNTPSTGNISAVGEESSGGSGLLGAIKAVDEAIGESSDGEGGTGLLGKLSQVDSTTLEKIIAQFGLGGKNPEGDESSEGSLLSAVNAVSDAIIGGKDDDKSLIGSLKKLSEESTLENVTTVTNSFTDLLTQIQTCIDKIGDLAEAITNLPSLPNGGGNGGSGGGSITPKAKGGIITKKSAGDFDYIAEAVGEDHTIAVKEGEAVIPKESVDQNPELVQSLIDGGLEPIDTNSIITDDGRTLIPYNPFPNVDFTKLMTPIIPDLPFTKFAMDSRNVKKMEQSTTVEFHGDIIVQGVQDADGFAKDIKYRLANIMTQELNKR